MKRMLLSAVMVLVAAGVPTIAVAAGGAEGKDLCLLASIDCPATADSILERIERLKAEVGKGTTVYTRDELVRLQWKLRDAEQLIETIQYGSGAA